MTIRLNDLPGWIAWQGSNRRTILSNGGLYDSTVHEPTENEDIERYYISV